jgi:hypothetical protein
VEEEVVEVVKEEVVAIPADQQVEVAIPADQQVDLVPQSHAS